MSSFSYNPYDMTSGYVLHEQRSSRSESPAVEESAYAHNPYDATTGYVLRGQSRSESPAGPGQSGCFDNTLHKELIGQANFEPFPALESNHACPALPFAKEDCCRLFIGQIPYGTPARQVEWMVLTATGRRVYFTETIQRWTGARAPKGCAHTYCLPSDRDFILRALHRRVLVDDSGIWIAADDEQHVVLQEYCERMKNDKTLRFRDRPYQPMVVEDATSDFVPRHRSPQPEAPAYFPPLYSDFAVVNGLPLQYMPQPDAGFLPPQYMDFVSNMSY